jgi:murein L,D-transpeptidase YafK
MALRARGFVAACGAALLAAMVWAHRSVAPLPADANADLIVIDKSARRLTLYSSGVALRTYGVALGPAPLGHKEREGDLRTPEGRYTIDWRNPGSAFHRALHISYPSPIDMARARRGGYPPGGDIMIHGTPPRFAWLGRAHRLVDWTRGCIAVSNAEIDEIWRAVPNGTVVEIRR